MWLEVKKKNKKNLAHKRGLERRNNRRKANTAACLHNTVLGLCCRAEEHNEGEEQRCFFSAGNCCTAVCLTVERHRIKDRHVSKARTRTHSNQYNRVQVHYYKSTRETGDTMKPNTTFQTQSADSLENSPEQCKHTGQNTHTHTQQNLPGHIVYRQNNSLFQKIRSNKALLRDTVRWFQCFKLGFKVKNIVVALF